VSSYHSLESLPAPDTDQTAHSERLVGRIVERIEQGGGVISFYDYMQACLYEPGLGYYTAGSVKFGPEGDFVTAPELTPLFGQTLGNYAAQLFAQGFAPSILEFGAGTGKLCHDLVTRLNNLGQQWHDYLIVETSADLRERQQAYLQQRLGANDYSRIHWLLGLPESFSGLVLGNEVLDAMPVNVVLKEDDWVELGVGFDGQRFTWQGFSQHSEAARAVRRIDRDGELPRGYCTEINLNYAPWCRSLAASCDQARLLLVDYGYEHVQYYHPERKQGTLLCFYRHRVHPDPFVYPGLQDITAFVDFDAFADAAEATGFSAIALQSQAQFLLRHGLLELGESGNDPLRTSQQVKQLTLPGEMGEKFKVVELDFRRNKT
jgi:SAM-dependent MidA family methyltransferase